MNRWDIATFANAYDSEPRMITVDWPGLCRALTTFDVINTDDKREIRAWSAATYPEGATRARGNVQGVSMLVLDIDDGTPVAETIERFADWPLVWHTSFSHTPEHPKYRVVLPLAESVPADKWSRAFAWAQQQADGHLDEATKDPSRLWFRPAVRAEDWPRDCGVHDPGGWLLRIDWERLPEPVEEARVRAATAPRPVAMLPKTAPDAVVRREVCERLKTDSGARERAAHALNATISGGGIKTRASKVACPQCGRPSVWFWIHPDKAAGAQCGHRNSCGWFGWLDQLLGVAA